VCPWRDEHDQFVRLFEKREDVVFKIGADIDFRFGKERGCATIGNFARDLFCYPGVSATVTHKYETPVLITAQ
jgi:hypothetical protein